MPPSSDLDALPPRLSLLGLPLEIKTEIVRMVRAQDVAYRARVPRPMEEEEEGERRRDYDASWYGRGTSALFMANKELSDLAAKHVFSELRSRCAGDGFKHWVLPNRGPLFVHAIVELSSDFGSERSDLRDFLKTWRFLPNLSTLTITLKDTLSLPSALYGKDDTDFDYALDAFRETAKRTHRLVFVDVKLSTPKLGKAGTTFLKQFPALKSLALQDVQFGDHFASFGTALSALSFLARLEIGRLSGPTIDWQALSWQTRSLRHLRLESYQDYDDLPLISIFAETLQSVHLTFQDFDPDVPDPEVASPTLPRLTTLSTIASLPRATTLLSLPAFSTSPLLRLELDISCGPYEPPPSASAYTALLDIIRSWLPTLRFLSIVDKDYFGNKQRMLPSYKRAIDTFCAAEGIATPQRVEGVLTYSQIDWHPELLDGADVRKSLEEISEEVGRVLATARKAMDDVVGTEDLEQGKRLLVALRGLIEHQAMMDD